MALRPRPLRGSLVAVTDKPSVPRVWLRHKGVLALAIVIGLAVALGIWIRLSILGIGSLWLDELWTLDAVSRSFKEMFGARLMPEGVFHPPLWSVVNWGWLRVVGTYDAEAVRLLPFSFSVAAIAAPLLGAIRLAPLRLALVLMAAVTALSLFNVQYAVELRSYSMMIAFGSAATVIWAGLLTGGLPRRAGWLFAFCLTGALAGFSHYYGHFLYAAEGATLLVTLLVSGKRGPARWLLAWGALSLAPLTVWLAFTSRPYSDPGVAGLPNWPTVQAWLAYAFGPASNVIAGRPAGHLAHGSFFGIETVAFGLTAAAILGATLRRVRSDRDTRPPSPVVTAGGWALLVVILGVASAWLASLVLPPSMNVKNLAALSPALFLAVACAATSSRSVAINRIAAGAITSLWAIFWALLIYRFGITSAAPSWHVEAGYSDTAQILIAATQEKDPPAFIGLEFPWAWHGEWDAVLRSELDRPPVESSSDPPPLQVRWISDVSDLQSSGIPATPLIVFTGVDLNDPRWLEVSTWITQVRAGCEEAVLGGPGYGATRLLRCPAAD